MVEALYRKEWQGGRAISRAQVERIVEMLGDSRSSSGTPKMNKCNEDGDVEALWLVESKRDVAGACTADVEVSSALHTHEPVEMERRGLCAAVADLLGQHPMAIT
jgi:hypothetical protein